VKVFESGLMCSASCTDGAKLQVAGDNYVMRSFILCGDSSDFLAIAKTMRMK
jgi:hypothetical protein